MSGRPTRPWWMRRAVLIGAGLAMVFVIIAVAWPRSAPEPVHSHSHDEVIHADPPAAEQESGGMGEDVIVTPPITGGDGDVGGGQKGDPRPDTGAPALDRRPRQEPLVRPAPTASETPVSVNFDAVQWPDEKRAAANAAKVARAVAAFDPRTWDTVSRSLASVTSPDAFGYLGEEMGTGPGSGGALPRAQLLSLLLSDDADTGAREAYANLLRIGSSGPTAVRLQMEFAPGSPRIVRIIPLTG